MTTQIQDHFITRGDPFKPGILTLTAKDDNGNTVDVPVSAYSDLVLTVRKNKALLQPDDTDTDVLAQVSLIPNAQGAIAVVGSNKVRPVIHGSVTKLWTQNEVFYDVQGHLAADGEPSTPVKGTIQLGWAVTQT